MLKRAVRGSTACDFLFPFSIEVMLLCNKKCFSSKDGSSFQLLAGLVSRKLLIADVYVNDNVSHLQRLIILFLFTFRNNRNRGTNSNLRYLAKVETTISLFTDTVPASFSFF